MPTAKSEYPVAPAIGHLEAKVNLTVANHWPPRAVPHDYVQSQRVANTSEFMDALKRPERAAVFAYAVQCMEGEDSYQTAIERACNALAEGVITPKPTSVFVQPYKVER